MTYSRNVLFIFFPAQFEAGLSCMVKYVWKRREY